MSSGLNSEPGEQESQPAQSTQPLSTLNPDRRGFWKSLKDRLWGYDFFISYHWASGGTYAVNLAQRLREQNYDVFLDRADYASGDDWKAIGEIALRNTQRLVLIATREAVTISKPVEHEIGLFTARNRQVISIVFGDKFEELDRSQYLTLNHMSDSQLYIEEGKENLASGPSDKIVAELIRTQGVMRRRNLRALLTLIPAIAVIAFAIFAGVSWWQTSLSEKEARKSEQAARDAEKSERKAKQDAIDKRVEAELRLATSLVTQGDLLTQSNHWLDARNLYFEAHEMFSQNDASPLIADMALLDYYLRSPAAIHSFPVADIDKISISTDGRRLLATTEYGKKLVLFEAATGRALWSWKDDEPTGWDLQCAALSPDGRFALSATGTVMLSDLKERRNISSHRESIACAVFSPDGRRVLLGGERLRLWDLDKNAESWSHELGDKILSVAFSPDGHQVLALALSRQNLETLMTLNICKVDDGTEIEHHVVQVEEYGFDSEATALLADPRNVAWTNEGTSLMVKRFAQSLPDKALTVSGHENFIQCIAFAPDGARIITGSTGRGGTPPTPENMSLRLWDLRDELRTYEYPALISSAAFSPDGSMAFVAAERRESRFPPKEVTLWDVSPEPEVRNINRLVPVHDDMADLDIDELWGFSEKGLVALGCGGPILALMDGGTGRQLWSTAHGHSKPNRYQTAVKCLMISADGRWAITGGNDKTVKCWDLADAKPLWEGKHDGAVNSVAISPGGRFALSGGDDGVVKLWDGTTGGVKWSNSCMVPVTSVAISPDGTMALSVSGKKDGMWNSPQDLRIWDRASGEETWLTTYDRAISSLAFSPNSLLVLCSHEDGVDLLDTAKRSKKSFHKGKVHSVGFSPDGRLALLDLTLCEVPTARVLRSFQYKKGIWKSTCSPDSSVVYVKPDYHSYPSPVLYDFGRMEQYPLLSVAANRAKEKLQNSPDDQKALRELGEWYAFQGLSDWAIDLLARARRDGEDVSSLTLARCYWQRSVAHASGKKSDLAAAYREFQQALEKNEAPEFYLTLCMQAVKAQLIADSQELQAEAPSPEHAPVKQKLAVRKESSAQKSASKAESPQATPVTDKPTTSATASGSSKVPRPVAPSTQTVASRGADRWFLCGLLGIATLAAFIGLFGKRPA